MKTGIISKAHKFGARKTMLDGEEFDSQGEANRYSQLRLLERAREIKALSRQPRFVLCVNGEEVCEYRADFAYFEGGRQIIEDFKGVLTREFLIKRKLFKALYPALELRVTNRKGEVVQIRTRRASKVAA